ncbi:MAG: YeiH family protein [Candidatus Dormibacteria bacterium]
MNTTQAPSAVASIAAPAFPGRALAPGLLLVAVCVAGAYALNLVFPTISPLIWAIFVGMAVAAVRVPGALLLPGTRFASRAILRVGVALLGFRLALPQLVAVGVPGLGVVGTVVPVTMLGTVWLARRLGCSPSLGLLVGSGSAICGASAVVAVDAVAESEESEVSVAVATVTVFGTAAMLLLPLLQQSVLHLSVRQYGTWAGASVHEVAQVIAAAAPQGIAAVRVATVVKLTRVLMLLPVVLFLGVRRSRQHGAGTGPRLPVPLFVLGFLGCVLVASTGLLPARGLGAATAVDTLLLAAALAGLGLGVDFRQIARLGWRPVALGSGAWALAALSSLGMTTLLVRP